MHVIYDNYWGKTLIPLSKSSHFIKIDLSISIIYHTSLFQVHQTEVLGVRMGETTGWKQYGHRWVATSLRKG